MPVLQLDPSSTHAAEFTGMGVIGAATAHEALSDVSDASYAVLQLTTSEPTKWWRGGLPDLPAGAGVVVSTVITVRAAKDDPPGTENGNLRCGEYPNVRISSMVPNVTPTDVSTAALTDLDVADINGCEWMAGGEWTTGSSVNINIYRMFFTVDFNYVNGVSVAMIFQLLGPLVAVGLHEMPGLRMELWRRSRLWLRPPELVQVWRDLRTAPHRRYVFA